MSENSKKALNTMELIYEDIRVTFIGWNVRSDNRGMKTKNYRTLFFSTCKHLGVLHRKSFKWIPLNVSCVIVCVYNTIQIQYSLFDIHIDISIEKHAYFRKPLQSHYVLSLLLSTYENHCLLGCFLLHCFKTVISGKEKKSEQEVH